MARFLLGFSVGSAIGVALVAFGAPRSGPALRRSINDIAKGALEAGRQATAARELEMWAEFRQRLEHRDA